METTAGTVNARIMGSSDHTNERLAVFILSSTHGLQHFLGRVFPPLIPLIATDLQLPLWKLGLIVSLLSVANGLGQSPMGHLSDRFDRRFILPVGVLITGIGYFTVYTATVLGEGLPTLTVRDVEWTGTLLLITVGMIISGVGRSATHPTGYPLLSANVSPDQQGKALGRWGSASKIGDSIGPAFVGIAILVLAWQDVFAIIAAVAAVYAGLLFVYMTRSSLETAPAQAQETTDEGTAEGGYWLPVVLVFLTMVAAGFASRGIGTYLPTFITEVYGFSFEVAGITFGAESVASIYFSAALLSGGVAILVVGNLADRYDPRDIMIALYLGATVTLAALAFVPLTPVTLLAVAVIIGSTLFAVNPARDAIISRVAPEDREGRIFGYFWTGVVLAGSGFPVLIGYLSDVVGIQQGFAYLAIGPLVAIVPLFVLKRKRPDG
ncbi:MAG: MFS transporter [Halobacteriales archaeon]|nr:MFS transporter [Halobacteriales archaeon]